jgi:hypothetical protein
MNFGTNETPMSSGGAAAINNRKSVQASSSTRKITPNSSRPSSAYGGYAQPSTSANRPVTANKTSKPMTNNLRNSTVGATGVAPQQAKVPITKKLKIPNVEERLVNFIIDEIVDVGQSVKFCDVGQLIF